MSANLSLFLLIRRGVDLLSLLLRQQRHLSLVAVCCVLLPSVVVDGLLLRHSIVVLAVNDSFEKHIVFILSVARAAVVGVEEVILAFDGVVLRRLRLLLPQAGERAVVVRYDKLVALVLRDHLLVSC